MPARAAWTEGIRAPGDLHPLSAAVITHAHIMDPFHLRLVIHTD